MREAIQTVGMDRFVRERSATWPDVGAEEKIPSPRPAEVAGGGQSYVSFGKREPARGVDRDGGAAALGKAAPKGKASRDLEAYGVRERKCQKR